MNTILALYFISINTNSVAIAPKLVGHCYSDEGEFTPHVVKILEVGKKEYRYNIKGPFGWFGVLSNSADTIDAVYPQEVGCDEEK